MFDFYLFTCTTYEQLTTSFISALLKMPELKGKICARKLQQYLYISESKGFHSEGEKYKEQIGKILSRLSPASFSISGREKALRSYVEKIEEKYPKLNRVKDECALRVIVSDKIIGQELAIQFCYLFAQAIIDQLTVIPQYDEIHPDSNEPLSDEIKNQIFIPSKSFLDPNYAPYVKDYIMNPNSKGYQSIHLNIESPKTLRKFEIQIRTTTMHSHAEYGPASHTLSYKPTEPLAYEKIPNQDFEYDATTKKIIRDAKGIIIPQPIGTVFRYAVPGDPITWI